MFKWISGLFKAAPKVDKPIDNWASLMAKICPACHAHPVKLYEGPSGGMSTNVFCSNCGQGYNMTPVIQSAETIGINMNYCDNDEAKARYALEKRFS